MTGSKTGGPHETGPPVTTSTSPAARRSEAQAVVSTVTHLTGRARCGYCHKTLPARRRRFCSDLCRIRGRLAERVTENADYAKAVVRQIRRMGVRASGDLYALQWMAGAVDYARDALAMAVDGCRARGYSDAEIGAALGITRQGVGQRFGRKRDVHVGTAETDGPA